MSNLLLKVLSNSGRRTITRYFSGNGSRLRSASNDEYTRVVKTFQPSLDASGKAEILTERKEIPRINIEQVIKQRKLDEKKARKLYIWDKYILVKLGKYKSISDVPDKIVYSDIKVTQQMRDNIKADMAEKGFKSTMTADYALWALCFILCAPVFYYYYKTKQGENKADVAAK